MNGFLCRCEILRCRLAADLGRERETTHSDNVNRRSVCARETLGRRIESLLTQAPMMKTSNKTKCKHRLIRERATLVKRSSRACRCSEDGICSLINARVGSLHILTNEMKF